VFGDFVGAEACADCHQANYDAWSRSAHGRAGGPPTSARVIAPFNGRPMRFRDAVVTPSVTPSGAFVFTIAQENRPVQTFRVDAVVGGGHMAGGGTQAFFSRFPDGTLRFLPFDYSQTERVWFCNTLGRADLGWLPVTPAIALADCGDWPPLRILGNSDRFQSCQQCHGSQIEVAFDTSTRRYETRFTTLAINCESCHGPGRKHVDLARSGRIGTVADIGLRSLATLTTDQSLEVCFQCHAAKTALEPHYLPGKPLAEHFARMLPLLLDTIYTADGRTRSFAYQEGHLASDCYLNGSMSCVDCHEPHSQRYRDVEGAPLAGRFSNGQCTGCHPSKAEPLEQHTHHRAASPGSLCVSCHMPYLQQPNVGPRVRYGRSDHTIPIPRPLHDNRIGIEPACQQCHRDKTPHQLQAELTAWYGQLKPHPAAVAGLLAADTMTDAGRAAQTILSANNHHPFAEFAGLTEVLLRYVGPDMATLDPAMVDRLEQRARSSDADVRALALATLHLARGADPQVQRFLASQLRALGSQDNAIRDRWAWILTVRGDRYLGSGDYESALAAFRKVEQLKPEDPAVLRSLGMAYTRLRDYARAIEHFSKSLALSPGDPQILVGLGFARMQQGDLDGAIAAYRQAIASHPWDPGGYANLGIAYLRRGEVQQAVEVLERAVQLHPGLVDAHFALANAYGQSGQLELAAAALERVLEFAPRNTAARQMLDAVRRQPPAGSGPLRP
jgi:Flp pilus assembly protein TadD